MYLLLKERGTWNLETRVQVLALLLSSFVTLGKHNLFEHLLSHL